MRKVNWLFVFLIGLFTVRVGWTEVTFRAKIEAELKSARIDYQTALLYKAYSLFDPSELPPEYQEKVKLRKSGTPIILELKAGRNKLDLPAQRLLTSYLARPISGFSHLSPSGNFRVHYDLSGKNAVDPTDTDPENGTPDYIDQVAATFDSCFSLEVDTLDYQAPPSDGSEGGGSEYDVYITDLSGRRVYGYTYPDKPLPSGFGCTSYIEIDNNYTDEIYPTREIDALRVTAAHEFFHALQFSYYAGEDARWWMEVCSTWMEDVVYDYVDDYYNYLASFFERPGTSLDTSDDEYEYGASVFAHYLAKRFGRDVIRLIWEKIGQNGTANISVFDQVIPGGMAAAMREFSLWNCYTGSRADTLRYYSEGTHYPEVSFRETHERYPAQGSGTTGHLAANYVRFIPREWTGGLRIDPHVPKGNWSFQVACFPSEGSLTTNTDVPGWTKYQQIVFILTETSFKGGPFGYSYSAQFDPDLTDGAPAATVLRQNWPNPFDIAKSSKTTISFDLRSPTEVILSIYSVNGQLVKREELGWLTPNSYHNFSWDGEDQQGRPVASGIYFYQIKASNFSGTKKMLLIK